MYKKSKSVTIIFLLIITCFIPGIKPLIAYNNNGTLTKPIANANGPYTGIVNQTIIFNGSKSFDPDGYIISYNWFFGDYSNKTGKIVNHSYTKPGVYLLTLLIIDNNNNFGCDETTVTIYEDSPPEIEIIHPIEKSIYYNDFYLFPYEKNTILIGTINITANATDDVGITKVEFYFDDTLQYTDYSEPYNWKIPQNHLKHYIKIIAYDSTGKKSSTQLDFFQWKLHPIFIIFTCLILLKNKNNGFDWISNENEFNSILINLLNNFLKIDSSDNSELLDFIKKIKNTKNEIKTKIIINFLNDHPYLKNKFKKTYPFIYFVLFYIKNEKSKLRNKILNSFYENKNLFKILFSLPPLIENFKPSDKLINSEFFDSSIIELIKNNPIKTAGIVLLLMLIFRNIFQNNLVNDEDINDSIKDNIAPIAIAKGPNIGYTNKTINFSAEGSYDSDGTISTYKWDFGDGKEDSGINVNHIYRYEGTYNITLLIIDNEGKTNYDFINIEIINNENKSEIEIENENLEYVIISGTLATILLLGLIVLKFRRKFFE